MYNVSPSSTTARHSTELTVRLTHVIKTIIVFRTIEPLASAYRSRNETINTADARDALR